MFTHAKTRSTLSLKIQRSKNAPKIYFYNLQIYNNMIVFPKITLGIYSVAFIYLLW